MRGESGESNCESDVILCCCVIGPYAIKIMVIGVTTQHKMGWLSINPAHDFCCMQSVVQYCIHVCNLSCEILKGFSDEMR